jgi:hypothetical protein
MAGGIGTQLASGSRAAGAAAVNMNVDSYFLI